MENISIRQGETLEFAVESDDESAVSVRFLATKNGTVYFDLTSQFDQDGQTTIRTEDTDIPVGEYLFTLTVTYSDGIIDILPDANDCDGDCDLPKLIVCESNVVGVIS